MEAETATIKGATVGVSDANGYGLIRVDIAKETEADWLTLKVEGMYTPVKVRIVYFNATGLAPGTYVENIVATSPDIRVAPLLIPVTLTVLPSGFWANAKSVYLPSVHGGGGD